jgi:hypothetical protein
MTDVPKKPGRKPGRPSNAAKLATTATTMPATTRPPGALPSVTAVIAHLPLSVLEVQDSADLDALLLDARLAARVVSRLSPSLALLEPGSEKEVLEALRKAGHLPGVVGG